jgi:hypothetical protein
MEPIQSLTAQYLTGIDILRDLFTKTKSEAKREEILLVMKWSHATYHKLIPKIQEEQLYLSATHRESSAALLRLHAKLQVAVTRIKEEIEGHALPVVPETWLLFVKERVRDDPTGKTTVKEVLKAYNRWRVTSGAKQLTLQEIDALCKTSFKGKGMTYDVIVFLDEEDLEEYDTNTK